MATLMVMSRVIGRASLPAEVRPHLAQGRSVTLAGPVGFGMSDALEDPLDQPPLGPTRLLPTSPGGPSGRLVGSPVTDARRAAVGYQVRDLLAELGSRAASAGSERGDGSACSGSGASAREHDLP